MARLLFLLCLSFLSAYLFCAPTSVIHDDHSWNISKQNNKDKNSGNLYVICASNTTELACQTQAAINSKFATWLATTTFTGGCNAALSNNNNGAPSSCGGSTTITFTVTSTCDPTVTCSAKFIVNPSAPVVIICPVSKTEAAGQTQSQINNKFATWLTTVNFSGGCNASIFNNSTGAPSNTGGSTTVNFMVTSSCEPTKTCSATFTVLSTPLTVICATNVSETACQTQAAIDSKFATWLTSVSFAGGCNAALSNNNTGAPNACGGSTTVTFTVTSTCDATLTCAAKFTVLNSPAVIMSCPVNLTEAAGQTQSQINSKFTAWLASANFIGGCNAEISNNNTGAPSYTGGTTTVNFLVTSFCEAPKTCNAKFAVASTPLTVNCAVNVKESACQTQAAIDAKFATWLTTVSFAGGCNAAVSNNSKGSPSACGGSTTITFTVTSACDATITCASSFVVNPSPPVVLLCSPNVNEAACQSQANINSKFANWLTSAYFAGGCNAAIFNNNTGAPSACGGSVTVQFSVSSSCEPTKICNSTFTVSNSPPVNLKCPSSRIEETGQTQAQIDAKFAAWLATSNFSGGCNGLMSNNNKGAPSYKGGTTTVKFTVSSGCEQNKICAARFSVNASHTKTSSFEAPVLGSAKFTAMAPTAANNSETIQRFELWPNPVNDNGIISVQMDQVKTAQLNLVNIYGQTIWAAKVSDDMNQIPVDLTGYSRGLYFVVLTTDKMQKVLKWVVD